MASIGFRYLVLNDGWPGTVNPNLSRPVNGWDNTTDSCVTSPTYPIGTKIQSYTDESSNAGYYVMCYMARADGSFAADFCSDIGDLSYGSVCNSKLVCCHYCGTTFDGNETYTPWYVVTGCATKSDSSRGTMRCAIQCCSATPGITDETLTGFQYGWFWVGGVCPCQTSTQDLTWLKDNSILTGGEISAGSPVFVTDLTNSIAFDGTGSAAEEYPVAWSIKADA